MNTVAERYDCFFNEVCVDNRVSFCRHQHTQMFTITTECHQQRTKFALTSVSYPSFHSSLLLSISTLNGYGEYTYRFEDLNICFPPRLGRQCEFKDDYVTMVRETFCLVDLTIVFLLARPLMNIVFQHYFGDSPLVSRRVQNGSLVLADPPCTLSFTRGGRITARGCPDLRQTKLSVLRLLSVVPGLWQKKTTFLQTTCSGLTGRLRLKGRVDRDQWSSVLGPVRIDERHRQDLSALPWVWSLPGSTSMFVSVQQDRRTLIITGAKTPTESALCLYRFWSILSPLCLRRYRLVTDKSSRRLFHTMIDQWLVKKDFSALEKAFRLHCPSSMPFSPPTVILVSSDRSRFKQWTLHRDQLQATIMLNLNEQFLELKKIAVKIKKQGKQSQSQRNDDVLLPGCRWFDLSCGNVVFGYQARRQCCPCPSRVDGLWVKTLFALTETKTNQSPSLDELMSAPVCHIDDYKGEIWLPARQAQIERHVITAFHLSKRLALCQRPTFTYPPSLIDHPLTLRFPPGPDQTTSWDVHLTPKGNYSMSSQAPNYGKQMMASLSSYLQSSPSVAQMECG